MQGASDIRRRCPGPVAGCSRAAQSDGPIRVLATFSMPGEMMEHIGGEHVQVTTLVGPDGQTHVLQRSPADGRAVREATIRVDTITAVLDRRGSAPGRRRLQRMSSASTGRDVIEAFVPTSWRTLAIRASWNKGTGRRTAHEGVSRTASFASVCELSRGRRACLNGVRH